MARARVKRDLLKESRKHGKNYTCILMDVDDQAYVHMQICEGRRCQRRWNAKDNDEGHSHSSFDCLASKIAILSLPIFPCSLPVAMTMPSLSKGTPPPSSICTLKSSSSPALFNANLLMASRYCGDATIVAVDCDGQMKPPAV